jgi:hypothetical protein
MRIALLTLEASRLACGSPLHRGRSRTLALVGLSDPFRREAGGALGQTFRRLRHSGPRIIPYLFLNFSAPRIAGAILPRRPGPIPTGPRSRASAPRSACP